MRAVVIVANGWNAGWLGCYGNEWVSTPNLDRLAAESIVFDRHFAVNPAPGGGFAPLASGQYAAIGDIDLFRSLRNYGVRTVRVHDLDERTSLRNPDGWDDSVAVPKVPDLSRGESLYGMVAEKLEELAQVEDWLLWIETDRLLPPWTVSPDFFEEYAADMIPPEGEEVEWNPEPWTDPPAGKRELAGAEWDRLHGTFAAVVTEWDAELGEWFDLFRELGLDESALWIVTSGHGLSLGEHDWIGTTGERLHEEAVHVPLMLRLPGADQAGRRVPFLSESIDLLPSLFDAFGYPLPEGVHGASLLPLAGGSLVPVREAACQNLLIDGRREVALRTAEWACLLSVDNTHPPLLFRLPEDRWEVNDARQQHLEWAEHMEATLRDFAMALGKKPFQLPRLKEYAEVIKNAN